ncbi:hypothetical protein [Pseudoalteromonas sp.]|uniref:hypothetical protein n=1 Tax=Pseudoalteromonas sp. TaxID=53249 RepID=UPI0035653E81
MTFFKELQRVLLFSAYLAATTIATLACVKYVSGEKPSDLVIFLAIVASSIISVHQATK